MINAMGGVGKTSLANALVNRYQNSFEHLIWLDAKIGVKEAFVNNISLIDNLNITADIRELNDGTEKAIDKSYDLVLNRLRALKKYGLLVLDDADEKMEVLAPVLSLSENWKILVTSRSALEGFEIYRLDFLGLQSAVNLFFHYAKIKRTTGHLRIAEEITSAVWCHTLTIELLAKTICDNDAFTIHTLKHALVRGGINAVPEYEIKSHYAQEKSNLETITTTTNACLKIAFDIYEFPRQPLLENLLVNFSVLPPIPIGHEAIEKIFAISADEVVDFNNGLKKLVNTSWLVKSDNGYHMHPVIQEVIREYGQVTPEKTAKLIAMLIEVSKSFDQMEAANLFLYGTYIKNVLGVFGNRESPLVATLAYNYAVLLRNVGRPKEALTYHQIAKGYREQFEPGSASLAEVLCGIGAVKINLGELDEAEDLMNQTILLQNLNLSPDDHNIAISHHNFAVIYKKMGDRDPAYLQKAGDHTQAAIDILIQNPDHQDELATAYILKGQLQKIQGNYAESKKAFSNALPIRSKIFGEAHNKTVKIYEDLALISKIEENWDEGYALMNKAMPVLTDYFEKESLSLGPSHHNYAFFLFKKGFIGAAIEEQKKAIAVFELHLAKDEKRLIRAKEQLDFFLKNR